MVRSTMASVAILLFGFCFSTVFMQDECSDFNKEHIYSPCYILKRLAVQGMDPNGCGQKIIDGKRKVDYTGFAASSNFGNEFCSLNGQREKRCVNCFSRAFQTQFTEAFCADISNILSQVRNCLYVYREMERYWQNNIIPGTGNYVIEFSLFAKGRCQNEFATGILPADNKISFPVRLKGQSDEYEAYINLVLTLLMKAVLHNADSKEFEVSCEDFVKSGFLQTYTKLSSLTIQAPYEVDNIYRNLRMRMCSDASNAPLCEQCFRYADQRFLYHLYNKDTANSVRKDFKMINQIYTNCIETHFGTTNSFKILILQNEKNTSWPDFSADCLDSKTVHYQSLIVRSIETLDINDVERSLLNSMFTNYIALRNYRRTEGIEEENACLEMKKSRIICAAAVTKLTILSFNEEKNKTLNSDQRLELLSSNLQSCDKDTFLTS